MHLRSVFARALAACALLAVAAASGCVSDSVHSTMTINDRLFGPDECKSLQSEEIYGVDLQDENSGIRLRLAVQVDESIDVVVFPNDGSHPVTMTGCAKVHLHRSDNDKEGRYEVDGDADIDCSSPEFVVKGQTSFENCGLYY